MMADRTMRRRMCAAWMGAVLMLGTGCQSSRVALDTQPVPAPQPAPAAAEVAAPPDLPPEAYAPPPPPPPAWTNPPPRQMVQERRTRAAEVAARPDGATPSVQSAPLGATGPQLFDNSGVSRVALLLPLTGRHARIGAALRNAAQLALFDWADPSFELMFLDTGGSPGGAREAAVTAISDGAALILGPLLADSTRAVGRVARRSEVPVVSFSNDSTAASDGVYVVGFRPETEVRRVVAHAVTEGARRLAVLAPYDSYGDRVVAEFQATARGLGAEITRVARYPDGGDYDAVIRQLADYDRRRAALQSQMEALEGRSDAASRRALARLETLHTVGNPAFDALLIADGGRRLQEIAALLPYYDIDPKVVRMLGTGQWDVAGIGTEPALIGGWYAAADPSGRAALMQRYTRTFGQTPPRIATLAYDATALAAVLVRGAKGPDYSAPTLTQDTGFMGTDGIFRLRPGGLGERALAVLEVEERGSRVIDPAPERFPEPGF